MSLYTRQMEPFMCNFPFKPSHSLQLIYDLIYLLIQLNGKMKLHSHFDWKTNAFINHMYTCLLIKPPTLFCWPYLEKVASSTNTVFPESTLYIFNVKFKHKCRGLVFSLKTRVQILKNYLTTK